MTSCHRRRQRSDVIMQRRRCHDEVSLLGDPAVHVESQPPSIIIVVVDLRRRCPDPLFTCC